MKFSFYYFVNLLIFSSVFKYINNLNNFFFFIFFPNFTKKKVFYSNQFL